MTNLDCLIIQQPYASLIAYGNKRWEFRGYNIKRRGKIGIAASHSRQLPTYNSTLFKNLHKMPRGFVIATADLVNVFFMIKQDLEIMSKNLSKVKMHGFEILTLDKPIGEPIEDVNRALKNRRWESFVWMLENVAALKKPIPFIQTRGGTWVQVKINSG